MSKLTKQFKLVFHRHKFEPDSLQDIERQLYENGHYNNTIFDNSTYRTYAFGRYYCDVCCPPNHGIFVDIKLTIGNEKHIKTVIDSWLKSHSAKVIDYVKLETLEKVTKHRGVVRITPLEQL